MSKHHLLFERVSWDARPESRRLRATPSLIPDIPRDIHDELHEKCPIVPLLGSQALMKAGSIFKPSNDTMTDMDRLMQAIEAAGNHHRAHEVEQHLADLAVWAIGLQRPFVRYGLRKGATIL